MGEPEASGADEPGLGEELGDGASLVVEAVDAALEGIGDWSVAAGVAGLGGGLTGSAAAGSVPKDSASMTTSVITDACHDLLLNAVPPELHERWRDGISR